jgi:hypothetical protein
MAAPHHVPVNIADKPRLGDVMPPADSWRANRPAEVVNKTEQPSGLYFGNMGPDQGYGLKLAKRFEDRLVVSEGEHKEDAVEGALAVGLKRASLFGRAPVIYDFELAYALFGFLGGAPTDLVAFRRQLFESARIPGHYPERRRIADLVPEETLRLTPAQVRERLADWRSLLTTA